MTNTAKHDIRTGDWTALNADAIKDLRLVPGMPVEAFIETSPRTVLSYLTKPLADQVRKTFRER